MKEERNDAQQTTESTTPDMRVVIREVIEEFVSAERAKAEPAAKTELAEERGRREQLERRVNELVAENERSRAMAEQTERHAAIRDELRRLGIKKVDLGFRAVKDDIVRAEDGRLVARTPDGEVSLQDHLAKFAEENPELLPARIAGGSGAGGSHGVGAAGTVDINSIKPGMDPVQLNRIRQDIAKVVANTIRKD